MTSTVLIQNVTRHFPVTESGVNVEVRIHVNTVDNFTECHETLFFCDGFWCLPRRFVCNGWPDCWDETDEDVSNCNVGELLCIS